jgi:branched-chain amino acid transport system ATP-binding protein
MLLEARKLNREFGGVRAVNDVSFFVEESEILGVVGANGSGKTTCLNILTRLVPPSSGAMFFQNHDYTELPAHRLVRLGISRTFQNLRLFKDLTVYENIALGAQTCRSGASEQTLRGIVDGLIDLGGLKALAKALPSALPYGTQRVVEILRALASSPRLIFLDEPFAGMSTDEARLICKFLLDMRATKPMALVIVDHNVEVLAGVAHRFVALAEGRVIATGEPEQVLTDPAVVLSYLGADD